MEDSKSLFLSKTFWGSIMAIVAVALQAFGVEDSTGYANDALAIIGGLIAIYGRIVAVKTIKTTTTATK